MKDHAPGTNDAVSADGDTSAHDDPRSQPNVFTEADRQCSLPTIPPLAVIIDRVKCGHQLGTRTETSVRANVNRSVVHEEGVAVDKCPLGDRDVPPVTALKPRHYYDAVADLIQRCTQEMDAHLIIVGPSGVVLVQ